MSEHTTRAYDKELDDLGRRIAEMGGISEKMVIDAMDALSNVDLDLAQQVIARIRASTRSSARSRNRRS